MNQTKISGVQKIGGDADDSAWVKKAQNGESGAWAELHRRYYSKLWGVVNQIVNNTATAEDVVQEAFIKAARQIKNFHGGSKFSTWIYRIAVNQAFDTMRRKKRRQKWLGLFPLSVSSDEDTGEREFAAPEPAVPDIERKDQRAALEKALQQLSPEHRAVVELRLVQGLSTDETARILDCKRGTVLSRLYYACQKLQPLLKKTYEELR